MESETCSDNIHRGQHKYLSPENSPVLALSGIFIARIIKQSMIFIKMYC